MPRRTLARRSPVVYLLESDPATRRVDIQAWLGDEEGRRLKQHPLGSAWVDEYDGPPLNGRWITSRDTDLIHGLPDAVRDQIFAFDDAIRDALG